MFKHLSDDLKAIVREGDELGVVTRGEFNKLVLMFHELREAHRKSVAALAAADDGAGTTA
jgi:hypothetical protein